jgi:choline kinase
MKSYGPKSLIELPGDQTVIGRQVGLLREAYPRAEIIAVVGFGGEQVIRQLPAKVKAVENELYAETNVARSIGMGLRVASHDHVLVVYGDLVFTADAVAGLAGLRSAALVDRSGQIGAGEVGLTTVAGRVTHFAYDLPAKWAQILYLTGAELALFRRLSSGRDQRNWFGFEVLNRVLDAGGSLRAVERPGMRIAEIDFATDIENARTINQERDVAHANLARG